MLGVVTVEGRVLGVVTAEGQVRAIAFFLNPTKMSSFLGAGILNFLTSNFQAKSRGTE